MNITNINLLGKEEKIQGTITNKQKGFYVEETNIGFMQPVAFLDDTVEREALNGEGLQDKAKSMIQGTTSNHTEFVANAMSENEKGLLEEQGIQIKDEDIETTVTVVEKIQLEMAKSGKTQNLVSNLSAEQIKAVVGDGAMAYGMAAQLKEITKEEAAYLINNDMKPTIGNIYQAQSSTYTTANISPLDENVKRKVEEKVKEYTGKAVVSESDKALAEWMVSAGVDFTKESFQYAKALTEQKLPMPEEKVSAAILSAVQSGNPGTEAMLLPGYDVAWRAEEGVRVIQSATPEQLLVLEQRNKEINLYNLAEIQEESEKFNQEIIFEKSDVKWITAKRILEETRLYMTAQANLSLLKKGIQIETKPLEELVNALKNQEQEYIKSIYSGNEEGEKIFSAAKEELRQFAQAPAYSLPKISFNEMTLSDAVRSGQEMAVILKKANTSYETMMTQPRRDLGDDIRKAFRNTEEILKDLGMEASAENERAVRILGYNQMEITETAVLSMKLKDEQVQKLFSNMTPRVVLSMIREGYNPLQVSLEDLNNKAEEMHQALDAGGYDSYGKFLVEMEQRQDITAEEREAYIGIYRLLHQVIQTDGAAIGALVKADEELTMKNLLTQVRNRKSTGYERVVDDKAGVLSEDFAADTSITAQINAAYQTECSKEALKHISVANLKSAEKDGNLSDMTPEQLLQAFREAQETMAEAEVEKYIAEQQQSMMRQSVVAETRVLEMLQQFDMPKSPENILALQQMLTDRNRLFKTLFDERDKSAELKEAIKEIKENMWEDFAEALSAPEEMAEAQEALAETAEHIMEGMLEDVNKTSIDIRELRRMSTQLQIMKARSQKEEYAVPVMISDEFGTISLKIVRGEKEEGKVAITLDAGAGRKIAAAFSALKNGVQGYVVSDSEEALEQLKDADEGFRAGIERQTGLHLEQGSIAYVMSKELSLARFEEGIDRQKGVGAEKDGVQTKTLYGIAKGFLLNFKEISL